MEKIFKLKSFNNFVWAPLGSSLNTHINFCHHFHFKVSAAWYCSHYLPPVSLIPVAIFHRLRWHHRQFAACIVDTGGKFATGVNSTRGNGGKICPRWQICRRCRWYRRQFATGVIDTGGKFASGVRPPQIFEKIRNDPTVIFRGLRESDSWKKPEAKNLVTLSP